MSKTTTRRAVRVRWLLLAGILVFVNVIASAVYTRIDLTADKRYSLSQSTRDFLRDLDDQVYVKVYLAGDLPSGLKQLQQATRDLLLSFKAYAGANVEYRFIDIYDYELEARKELSRELYELGIRPTTSVNMVDGTREETLLFPGAVVSYKGRELGVQLLENQVGYDESRRLQNAIVQLEFAFANTIQKLAQYRRPVVAFTEGHGELASRDVSSLAGLLEEDFFEVRRLDLATGVKVPDGIDVLVVAGPTRPFDEGEKFKIDQFIMNGGKVLWAVDPMVASMDSMQGDDFFLSLPRELNLDDILYKYGVRLNKDLVQDGQMQAPVPVVTGESNGVPETQLFPWVYHPLLIPGSGHGIVRNIDPVWARFASTIDTIRVPGIEKHVLLTGSQYGRAPMAPVRVHLSQLTQEIDPAAYGQPFLPVAISLEGTFRSVFENRRFQPGFLEAMDSLGAFTFRDSVADNKMIVVADADVLRNDVAESGTPYVLGYNRYSRTQYANAVFVLNCIEYLLDRNNLIDTRSKEITLRRLDPVKARESRGLVMMLNVALPVLLVVVFGVVFHLVRRRRYAQLKT